MSKQTDDLIDKLQGAATALRGVRAKLSPQPVSAAVEVVTPAAPAPAVTQEDFDFAKKVVAEIKATIEALEAEVSRESKVPEPNAGPTAPGSAEEHKSTKKAS